MFLLLEEMSSEFEEAVELGGGWTELALPSEEEAQRYFASFRRAPPDNSALAPGTQVRSRISWMYLSLVWLCHSSTGHGAQPQTSCVGTPSPLSWEFLILVFMPVLRPLDVSS